MLLLGSRLNERQRRHVLNAFIYRWTNENLGRARQAFSAGCQHIPEESRYPRIEPVSDEQWLADHAFHFNASGTELDHRHEHAEPAYMAEGE